LIFEIGRTEVDTFSIIERSRKKTYTCQQGFFLVIFCAISVCFGVVAAIEAPKNISIEFSEKNYLITWDSVPGAIGYNVYSAVSENTTARENRKLNAKLVRSGTRFVFIWLTDNGQRERKVKGYPHCITVTAVGPAKNDTVESDLSAPICNDYFDGFSEAVTKKKIQSILIDTQRVDTLPLFLENTPSEKFISFMTGPGDLLMKTVRDSINFLETGACVPVSTVAVQILQKHDIASFKVEGTFISEFHTFIVLKIDRVEYVLDFTADQFVPGVSPVLVPRDFCFLDGEGNLGRQGEAMYQIGKVMSPDQSTLLNTDATRLYHNIENLVCARYPGENESEGMTD